jgi:hypothetical protein
MATKQQYTAAANAVVKILVAELNKMVPSPELQAEAGITSKSINALAGEVATAAVDAAMKLQTS